MQLTHPPSQKVQHTKIPSFYSSIPHIWQNGHDINRCGISWLKIYLVPNLLATTILVNWHKSYMRKTEWKKIEIFFTTNFNFTGGNFCINFTGLQMGKIWTRLFDTLALSQIQVAETARNNNVRRSADFKQNYVPIPPYIEDTTPSNPPRIPPEGFQWGPQ